MLHSDTLIHPSQKRLGTLKALSPLRIKGAVGLAKITSSTVLPCFLSLATFSRASISTSRNSVRSAFPPTAPWPGITTVVAVALARFAFAARI